MPPTPQSIDITVIGGGMYTREIVLPSVYELQRQGLAGQIRVVGRTKSPLRALRDDPALCDAFPGHSFIAVPEPDDAAAVDDRDANSDLYISVLDAMPAHQAVVVVLPDPMHYGAVKAALLRDQHVLCVKPFTLSVAEAEELETMARERGLFIGIEYHKRFDRRSLIAKHDYRNGRFGEFVMGEAKMIEPYAYRFSNFQNWFTAECSDPFVYVGCHYVDLACFITGLAPVAVSVAGVKRPFPNGNDGYMWTHGRVHFENGAILSVINGLGYPDEGGGMNDQNLVMYCEGDGKTGVIEHDDQFRGVAYTTVDGDGPAYRYVNPDFFNYVDNDSRDGARPIGYGYESIAAILGHALRIEHAAAGLDAAAALSKRQELIREVDDEGMIATPANSRYNEQIIEAARQSILNDGVTVGVG